MQHRLLGTKYKNNRFHSQPKYEPYDYASNGLLNRLLPSVIIFSDNMVTQTILLYIDQILTRLMKYVDKIKYYRDWNRPEYR